MSTVGGKKIIIFLTYNINDCLFSLLFKDYHHDCTKWNIDILYQYCSRFKYSLNGVSENHKRQSYFPCEQMSITFPLANAFSSSYKEINTIIISHRTQYKKKNTLSIHFIDSNYPILQICSERNGHANVDKRTNHRRPFKPPVLRPRLPERLLPLPPTHQPQALPTPHPQWPHHRGFNWSESNLDEEKGKKERKKRGGKNGGPRERWREFESVRFGRFVSSSF